MSKPLRFEDNKLKRKYFRLKIAFFVTLLILIFTLYKNYNYMIFKLLISTNYIYTKSLDAIYNETIGEGNYKNYNKDFDKVMISLFTKEIRSIDNDKYTYLYNPNQYTQSKEYSKTEALDAKIEKLDENTVYMLLPNISKYTRIFVEENILELKKYKNIIIDLRTNYGGELLDLYKIENLFLEKGSILGYETTRLSIFTKKIKAKKDKVFDFENIVILQSESTASAAEGFIMSLKENLTNVTTLGTTTFGKGIGQVVIPLTNGYAVKATVLTVETPNNNSIHKVGITPDIEYTKDDILDRALKEF